MSTSTDLYNWIWTYSKTDSQTLLVLLALASRANLVGESTVKLAELAKLCRGSEANVRHSLRSAVLLKEIEIFQNTDAEGNRTTNTYKFTVMAATSAPPDGEEDDINFDDPSLPGIPVPKVRDLPQRPQPRIMMDDKMLAAIAADPLYKGMDVHKEAWKFKRWCTAKGAAMTVTRFKVWLSKV
jgi:hypothetical protein